MSVKEQIKEYINSQPEPKRSDMQALHHMILEINSESKLWFLDGKNDENKTVSNPNVGYGFYNIKYANGTTKEFYRVGMSGNTSGLSVFIMGIADRKYLPQTYSEKIGKASVTSYCIKFKALKDINISILEAAIRFGLERPED